MTEVSVENTDGGDHLSWFRIIKMLLVVIIGCVVLLGIFIPVTRPREIANRMECSVNLRALTIALNIYAQDYSNSYPTHEKWCDLLVSSSIVESDRLFCRGSDAKKGQSSYCLNMNIAGKKSSEIPSDIVLLFETKGGWNQIGGPEKLTFDNHDGKYCGVLFKDGNLEFIKPDQLGQLKWDIEKKDGESVK
jgi:hypothetical protein